MGGPTAMMAESAVIAIGKLMVVTSSKLFPLSEFVDI